MADYIKREDALDALTADALERNLDSVMTDTASRYHRAAQRVVTIVPAADVRPVVFCKNCQYCHSGYCERFDDLIPFGVAQYEWENWYCADGKRREDT